MRLVSITKISFATSITLTLLVTCSPKEKKTLEPDTLKPANEMVKPTASVESPKRIPIDTITASYSNGTKLHLLVLAYHDSLPGKPIKDFEVREADTKDLIFRSVAKRLALGDEVDPINGRFDSLFVVPIYTISSKDPLTVELDFQVDGDFRIGYLGDVTYPFYESRPWNRLSFLSYTFQIINSTAVVKSSLRFTPHKCNLTETELVTQFNKRKNDGHLDTENGGELMKGSFICFLNGANSNYEMMNKEFKSAFGDSVSPYYYYPYVAYLDKFFVNFNLQ